MTLFHMTSQSIATCDKMFHAEQGVQSYTCCKGRASAHGTSFGGLLSNRDGVSVEGIEESEDNFILQAGIKLHTQLKIVWVESKAINKLSIENTETIIIIFLIMLRSFSYIFASTKQNII